MHIGIDGYTLGAKIKAGVYIGALDLLKNIITVDADNKYTVYLRSNYNDELKNYIKAHHVTLKHLFCPSKTIYGRDLFLLTCWLPFSLPIELIKSKPDILFSAMPTLPLFCPCKTIIRVHDLAYLLDNSYFKIETRLAIGAMTSRAIKRSDKIIAISESTKKDLITHFGVREDKISVIYRSHNADVYKPSTAADIYNVKQKYNISANYVIYVGTLEPRKNVVGLIKAFGSLKEKERLGHKLVITGAKGWLYQDIFEMISEMGLEQMVIFTGFVPEEELPILMSGARILIYPSFYEGFGLPPLQAMACGTPVITSKISSMPEVVGDAGWLIDPYNQDELTDAIKSLLADDQLRKIMSQKGLERAKLFSPVKEAQQTIELFNTL
jgi:glycosyltransferase involved in cell wall biosynthesis